MQMRIASIVQNSVVDGEGTRTVLYMQGCSIGCKGCQNFAIWNKMGGTQWEVEDLAKHLVSLSEDHHNYTIQGGEPTDQPDALCELLCWIKQFDPEAHITLYTGRLWEDLKASHATGSLLFNSILLWVDVLVDGPFIFQQDDPFIMWRGSRNQRPIDVKASRDTGELVLLDWDAPQLIITEDGFIKLPVGLAPVFEELGQAENSRRCGDYRQ
jgi:anaerobic ribonucleoside-triphosphate reductase activating protein